MAVKSIIDVDVNDDAFKAFMEMFAKYQAALKKLPGAWDAASKPIEEAGSVIEDMTSDMEQQLKIIGKQITVQEKMRREVEKTNRSMTDLGRSTARVAGSVKDTTLSLLKWSTIGFGFLTAGSFFGLGALARSSSQTRTQAMGVSVTPAQLQAANLTYERLGGVDPILSSIAQMQSDEAQLYRFDRFGIENAQNLSPFEILPRLLEGMGREYGDLMRTGGTALAPSDLGSTDFGFSPNMLRVLAQMYQSGELRDLNAGLSERARTIGGNPDSGRTWANFLADIGTAGARFQTTLIDVLTPLAKPISNVVDAFGRLVSSILSSQEFQNGLKTFAEWIDRLAETLKTPEARTAVSTFIEQMGELGNQIKKLVDSIGSFVERIDRFFTWNPSDNTPAAQEERRRRFGGRGGSEGFYGPQQQNKEAGSDAFRPMSYTAGDYNSFIDQMTRAESGGRDDARNPRSSASGRHQFIDETWLSVARRFGGSRIAGMSEEQILALRSDADFSRQMALSHTQFDIAPELLRSGVDPTNLALYAGWHFGARGGAAVMQAGNDTPMSQILSSKAIAANPHLQNLTAGQWRNRYSGQFPGGGEGQPGRQVLSVQPGQAVHVVINDNTGGNIVNTSASLGAPGYYA
jgi:methyl-accepting chemotaxis protein